MRNQRSFSLEFKRRVVEELLSGESHPAQLRRRYNIALTCPTIGVQSTLKMTPPN